jgi:hypothetical protein
MFRPTNVITKTESKKLMWFGQMIAGPSAGMFSSPSMFSFQSRRESGCRTRRSRR